MNFVHAAMDLTVGPIEWYQIALMVIVFINGVALNILAYQWIFMSWIERGFLRLFLAIAGRGTMPVKK